MNITDAEGTELACCNVVLKWGKECEEEEDDREEDDASNRRLAAQDKLSFGQN